METWFSAEEYREAIDAMVACLGYPPLKDAEFYEQTHVLIKLGLVRMTTVNGVRGFAVQRAGIAMSPLRGH